MATVSFERAGTVGRARTARRSQRCPGMKLAFAVTIALAACNHVKGDASVPGPQLGDSTARGPTNPNSPLADAAVTSELSTPIRPRTGPPGPTTGPTQPPPPPEEQPNVFSPPPDGGTR
jgi:hypothetical protein